MRLLKVWLCQPWETSHSTRNHQQRQEERHKEALAVVMGPSRVAAEAPGMFKTKMHKDLRWTKLGTQCHLLAIREKIWEICYRRETGSSQPPGGPTLGVLPRKVLDWVPGPSPCPEPTQISWEGSGKKGGDQADGAGTTLQTEHYRNGKPQDLPRPIPPSWKGTSLHP